MEFFVNTLFLHFGPGSHCFIERSIFKDSLPIDWWDQPVYSKNSSECLKNLRLETLKRFQDLANKSVGKASIIANSYGASLAIYLAETCPQLISKLTILGGQASIRQTYLNLAGFLLKNKLLDNNFSETVSEFETSGTKESFWNMISEMVQVPDLMNYYWGARSSNFNTWIEHVSEKGAFDFDSFSNILNDHFEEGSIDRLPNLDVDFEVNILLGNKDPFSDLKLDFSQWREIFPKANIKELDCGHFIHLETTSHDWIL